LLLLLSFFFDISLRWAVQEGRTAKNRMIRTKEKEKQTNCYRNVYKTTGMDNRSNHKATRNHTKQRSMTGKFCNKAVTFT
jgi:hypothetical protein